jgi:DNA topoisomerase I
MAENLVVVESPAKSKTIEKYLGKDYKVLASFGHIRELPSKTGSVDPEKDFKMDYQLNAKTTKAVKALVNGAKGIKTLILATDPDREGEAIAWHVAEVLKKKKVLQGVKIERVSFNAITKKSVTEAIEQPRKIDMDLVNAQQARLALDYLVGFTLSPVLWRKLPGSKSAGRVQSVALRLICEREDEIEAFKPEEYWNIDVELLNSEKKKLIARLTHIDGKKLEKFDINKDKQANDIAKILKTKNYEVVNVEKKQVKRNPYAPFTTSTLQQEASRKLGFSAKKTMMTAQRLYEGIDVGHGVHGLITYMRTDGVFTTPEAIQATRELIKKDYGDKYLPEEPIIYKNKIKNSQEAHEAIRPTDPKLRPQDIKKFLNPDEFKLYDLIWKRLVASQMSSVVMDRVAVIIKTKSDYGLLKANGSVINFDGFYVLYKESKDDDKEEKEEKMLPKVEIGENLKLEQIVPSQHFTEPEPRYSEASLVKTLEALGIGRPSTYASILHVLQNRGYVKLEQKRFYPEERGRIVTTFLKNFFSAYVQYDYTAKLEDDLDEISNGKENWKEFLQEFWKPFHKKTEEVLKISTAEVIDNLSKQLANRIFERDEKGNLKTECPQCQKGELKVKFGKFGVFLACSNYPECKYTRNIDAAQKEGGNTEMQDNQAHEGERFEPKVLGQNTEGANIYLKKGPYGFYIQLGEDKIKPKPKRASLPKTMNHNEVDLEKALSLLTLPRLVGKHPTDSQDILANIGPYGPYLKWNNKFYSVKKDDILTIGLNRAVVVIDEVTEAKKKKAVEKSKKKK